MVDAIGSVFQTSTSSTSSASSADAQFQKSSDMYLQLFLAQLKNQDPTEPFDTAQMTQQLSTLNNTQQAIQTNKNLESLITLYQNSQGASLASFINKNVEYLGDTFYVAQGDTKNINYYLSDASAKTTITITDGNGTLVNQYTGDTDAGTHTFSWDGKDQYGNQVATGTYKISVASTDSSGNTTSDSTFLTGTVTGVDFTSSSTPVIFVGNDANRVGVDLSRISAILDSSASASTINPTTTNTTNTNS